MSVLSPCLGWQSVARYFFISSSIYLRDSSSIPCIYFIWCWSLNIFVRHFLFFLKIPTPMFFPLRPLIFYWRVLGVAFFFLSHEIPLRSGWALKKTIKLPFSVLHISGRIERKKIAWWFFTIPRCHSGYNHTQSCTADGTTVDGTVLVKKKNPSIKFFLFLVLVYIIWWKLGIEGPSYCWLICGGKKHCLKSCHFLHVNWSIVLTTL